MASTTVVYNRRDTAIYGQLDRATSRYHAAEAYLLPADEQESQRLASQHSLLRKVFGDRVLFAPMTLDGLRGDIEVLDVGTGSGIWALDFFLTHCVSQGSRVKISGIDIGDRLFPVNPPYNITFSLGSVLNLPASWTNRFRLVHQRLLIAALRYDEWPTVITELFRVTKPGDGYVQLCEINKRAVANGPSSSKALRMMDALMKRTDKDPFCTERIPSLMKKAGFVDIKVHRRELALGPSGGGAGMQAAKIVVAAMRGMKGPLMKLDGMGFVKGGAEFEALINSVEFEWKERPGARVMWFMFTGRKPH